MSRKDWLFWVLFGGMFSLFSSIGLSQENPQPDKPFKRAIILSGMGLNFVTYLGLYDAALASGVDPDLVIGVSGGSVASAIIAAHPDQQERMRFLESEEFYRFFESIQVIHPRPVGQVGHLIRLAARRSGIAPLTPNLETRPLINLPERVEDSLDIPFPSRPKSPAILLVAGRLDYPTDGSLRPSRKLFTETWFTDPDTANYLEGIPSPVGSRFPRGAVNAKASVVASASITQAMKASIAEPLLLSPVLVEGERYTGGGIDAWPVEMADFLAEETVVPRPNDLTPAIRMLFNGVFQYGNRKRWKETELYPRAITVDMADYRDALKDVTFWFKIKMTRDGNTIPRPMVVFDGPQNHEDFVRRTKAQYAYGYRRGLEAFGK